ncbi:MAG: hypothetical protein SFV51_17340 [Bryobacteraceae bacterium]|nr:hypothetical protein [Bryobacteraceae bacterium]
MIIFDPNQVEAVVVAPFLTDIVAVISFLVQWFRAPSSFCAAFGRAIIDSTEECSVVHAKYTTALVAWKRRMRLDRLIRSARSSSLTSLCGVFTLASKPEFATKVTVIFALWLAFAISTSEDMNWGVLSDDDVRKRTTRAAVGFSAFVLISIAVKAAG